MLAQMPVDLKKVDKKNINREVLRIGMIAELDAVNLYEQLAAMATDRKVKAALEDIAREEKTHLGEFLELLLRLDEEQVEELEKGKEEIKG